MSSNTTDPAPGTYSIYPYSPNKELPIIFAVIISCLGGILLIQSLWKSYWPRFAWIATFASTVWVTGFIIRAISVWTIDNQENVSLYIAQYVLILVGPALYAASESFLLGRLMAFLPYHAPIHPGRVLSTFIFFSVVVEALMGAGAGIASGATHDQSTRDTGYALVCAGLILQGVLELAFISLTAYIHRRATVSGHASARIHTLCAILYLTSSQMIVRCVVRAVGAFEEKDCAPGTYYCGYVNTQEWVEWVFEVGNITLVVAILAALPPRRFLPSNEHIFLDLYDKTTMRLGPGFSTPENRGFAMSVVDPFDLVGILSGRGQRVEKFWEREWPVASSQDCEKDLGGAGRKGALRAKLEDAGSGSSV